MSPAPCHAHQTVVGNLYVLLAAGGDMSLTIRRPFPVEVVLARLLD